MTNELTGEYDVCLQLSPATADMLLSAFGSVRSTDGPCPPHQEASGDDAFGVRRVRRLRELLDDRGVREQLAGLLPHAATLRVGRCEAVQGAIAVFADGDDTPPHDAPVQETEAFLGGDEGFGIALSQEYLGTVVRREITGVPVPNQFEVRLKGQRGSGLVRWSVTVDLRSAGAVLHRGGPPGAEYEDMPRAVLVGLQGTSVARGLGSLYADLNFTFELLVPFVPEISGDHITFRPGEAQFRLLRVPIAIEAFRAKILASVGQHLSVMQEAVPPVMLDLGHVEIALRQGQAALRPAWRSAEVAGGALVLRGHLVLEPTMAVPTADQHPSPV